MPRNPRDYAKERKYDGKPSVKKKRAARNRARYALEKEGKVSKGQDVDHKDGNPSNNKRGNLRVMPASKNRSYPRTKTARKKS